MAERKDVLIKAPPAVLPKEISEKGQYPLPTPEELCALQAELLKGKEKEIEHLKVSLETIANVACSLVFIMIEKGLTVAPQTIGIFKDTSDRMKGAKLVINEDRDRNVIVELVERGPRLRAIK